MSLPNYLAKIKSSGMYRFTFDKSQVPPQSAETMRLVVGYSDKGPFNNPVYIDNKQDFINLFGNINKRLEKKGIFFHRMALQALSAGPILALNLKPFDTEKVGCAAIDGDSITANDPKLVKEIFDTTRFWKLEPENLNDGNSYMHICAVDSKQTSTSIFVRKPADSKVGAYNLSVAEWYTAYNTPIPDYLVGSEDKKIKD